jgi:hypothetical protein
MDHYVDQSIPLPLKNQHWDQQTLVIQLMEYGHSLANQCTQSTHMDPFHVLGKIHREFCLNMISIHSPDVHYTNKLHLLTVNSNKQGLLLCYRRNQIKSGAMNI